MIFNTMKLLFKALDRGLLARSVYPGWYESEGFIITKTGWVYTIKHQKHMVMLDRDTLPQSSEYKEFKSLLTKFLDISFPA
jgi:hypothetical protein